MLMQNIIEKPVTSTIRLSKQTRGRQILCIESEENTDYFTHTDTSIRTCYSPARRKFDAFFQRIFLFHSHCQLSLLLLYNHYTIVTKLKRLHSAVLDRHTDDEEGECMRFILPSSSVCSLQTARAWSGTKTCPCDPASE